tara:strand:- start:866 stop:985 length:120 start_codon:yes stop_codon:yes gene_type:complete
MFLSLLIDILNQLPFHWICGNLRVLLGEKGQKLKSDNWI